MRTYVKISLAKSRHSKLLALLLTAKAGREQELKTIPQQTVQLR